MKTTGLLWITFIKLQGVIVQTYYFNLHKSSFEWSANLSRGDIDVNSFLVDSTAYYSKSKEQNKKQ